MTKSRRPEQRQPLVPEQTRPVQEGDVGEDQYELQSDEDAQDPQWEREPKSSEESVSGGEGGLSEYAAKTAGGPEGGEPAITHLDDQDSEPSYETHGRLGDEAGFTPRDSENWSRQEFDALRDTERPEPGRQVPELGTPDEHRDSYAFGGNPGLSYSGNEEPAYHGKRFYQDDAPPPKKEYSPGDRSDEEIYREISDRLAEQPELSGAAIRIAVEGGHVTLRGKVDGELPRILIEDLVQQVSGVQELRDELKT